MNVLSHLSIASFFVVAGLVAGCAKPPPTEASYDAAYEDIRAYSRSELFRSCPAPQVDRAQRSVASWFEVIRYLEDCDLTRARYYTNDVNRGRIADLIARSTAGQSAECVAEGRDAQARVSNAVYNVRSFVEKIQPYCHIDFRGEQLANERAEFDALISQLECESRAILQGVAENDAIQQCG